MDAQATPQGRGGEGGAWRGRGRGREWSPESQGAEEAPSVTGSWGGVAEGLTRARVTLEMRAEKCGGVCNAFGGQYENQFRLGCWSHQSAPKTDETPRRSWWWIRRRGFTLRARPCWEAGERGQRGPRPTSGSVADFCSLSSIVHRGFPVSDGPKA